MCHRQLVCLAIAVLGFPAAQTAHAQPTPITFSGVTSDPSVVCNGNAFVLPGGVTNALQQSITLDTGFVLCNQGSGNNPLSIDLKATISVTVPPNLTATLESNGTDYDLSAPITLTVSATGKFSASGGDTLNQVTIYAYPQTDSPLNQECTTPQQVVVQLPPNPGSQSLTSSCTYGKIFGSGKLAGNPTGVYVLLADNNGNLMRVMLQAVFYFALSSSVPIFNDFAGNGLSGALLYDSSLGQSYTALSSGHGTYSYVGNLFTPSFDTLRTGDFNGDGIADLILYNSQNGLAYIGFGKGDGTFAFQSLFWSPGYNDVETGDINGDGKTDVALYDSTNGTLYTGISNGDGTFTYRYHLVSQNYTFIRLADFNGDGKADLFLYRVNDGVAYLGISDGTGAFAFNPLSISAGYNLADVGDLNDDGKADIILYNGTNGNAATGISNGSGGFAFTPLSFSQGFTSVRLADYTGHAGKADVTVYNKNTAAAYFGTGNGDGTFNFQSLFWSPGYDYVVPEDVNGDGKTDIVLYNSVTGTEYTGLSNGNGTFTYTYSYWGIGKLLAQ